jgi:pyruvate dehydrogenase (quinone)
MAACRWRWRSWRPAYNLPIKIIVINNFSLGQIQWEQMTFLGHPEFGCVLEPVVFARVAEGCGLTSLRITRSDDCAALALRN